MLTRISHTFIYVLDQDEALDFYVGKLGMVVHTDADLGAMRWLTVTLPDQPDLQLALMQPGSPVHDDATAEQIRELVAKGGAGGGLIFETDDSGLDPVDVRVLDPMGQPRSCWFNVCGCRVRTTRRSAGR